MIIVDGMIQTRTYEDRNGNKRKAVEVVANHVEFIALFSIFSLLRRREKNQFPAVIQLIKEFDFSAFYMVVRQEDWSGWGRRFINRAGCNQEAGLPF